MVSREQREIELVNSGIIDIVKRQFYGRRINIPEKYFILIADYIDTVNRSRDQLYLDPNMLLKRLPEVLNTIIEKNIGGIYGRTDGMCISMNNNLDYERNKLYFFHELTHALQTSYNAGKEKCGFYNGKDGMFLTEGATQFTAELLYHLSNDTDFHYHYQNNTVRGQSDKVLYNPLHEYQYNANILVLLSNSMDLSVPQVLSLAYQSNGREVLKGIYESMNGTKGKFDELMSDLEKLYSMDKIIIAYGANKLNTTKPTEIINQNGRESFLGNLQIQKELMTKVERQIASNFIANHDEKYIVNNYKNIAPYLTDPDLKKNFMNAVCELQKYIPQNSNEMSM